MEVKRASRTKFKSASACYLTRSSETEDNPIVTNARAPVKNFKGLDSGGLDCRAGEWTGLSGELTISKIPTATATMADAILGVLLENLNKLIQGEFGLIWGVQHDLNALSSTLTTIQAVLEDAEMKQFNDKPIKNWVSKLKDAAYDADDVLDEWLMTIQSEQNRDSTCINQVRHYATCCFDIKTLVFRRQIAKRVKEIMQKFDAIANERSKFHLVSQGAVGSSVTQSSQNRTTGSAVDESKIYGRQVDKEKIVSLLVDEKNVQSADCPLVYPIVGIGGLGKTTLAQIVYKDERVVKYFEKRMWVCVSEDFDLQRLNKLMIESLSGKFCDLSSLDAIQTKVAEMLGGKRFLLVLDDVWNKNQDDWNKLKESLICGAKGSSIVVTTREKQVASITGTISAHELDSLPQDYCWDIFRHCAFGLEKEGKPNLEKIGCEIVLKCGGVPLAVKTLGSLLRFKSEEREWERVRDNEIWEVEKGEENMIMSTLRLSYNNLSPVLRQCLAYCSVFPKDFKMKKNELIRLWMANGFIQHDGRLEVEDVGERVFSELVWRSMFQDIEEDRYGSIETCKIHDLLHDLTSSVAEEECLSRNLIEEKNSSRKIRHLSFSSWDEGFSFEFLRTLMSVSKSGKYIPQRHLLNICSLRCLRSLSLNSVRMDALPLSIGNLMHLRYLNISSCGLESLPDSMGRLKNLQSLDMSSNDCRMLHPSIGDLEQLRFLNLSWNHLLELLPESICDLSNLCTLDVSYCSQLKELPRNLGKLRNLKHLHNVDCEDLSMMPFGIGQMTQLQTLETFIVCGAEDGIQELHALNLLRGKLSIEKLERVRNPMEAKAANLISKENLSYLLLIWSVTEEEGIVDNNAEAIIEALQPPPNIRELWLWGYPGAKLPNWINLTSLRHLIITECPFVRSLPKLGIQGCISSLVSLWISRCPALSSVSEGLQHLTSLQRLEVWDCPKLEYSAECFDHLIALQRLSMDRCPNIITPSAAAALVNLTSLRELSMRSCDSLTSLPRLSSSLVQLGIRSCNALSSVSEGLQHLTSLENLEIKDCPELEFSAECFDYLTALQRLNIECCPKLMSLTDGLQHCYTLQSLQIANCHPDLERRCKKDEGPDWSKIAHIPRIWIKSSDS